MREAAIRLSRPRAAADIARFLAGMSGEQPGEDAGRDLLPTLIAD
jgi:hypothetical protein